MVGGFTWEPFHIVANANRPGLQQGVPLMVASLAELDHLTLVAFIGDRKLRAEDGAGNPRIYANLHEYQILKIVSGAGELGVSLLRG